MKILIEGEKYDLELLRGVFDDLQYISIADNSGIVNAVGYYHSFNKNTLVYILPKVFLIKGKVLDKYTISDLLEIDLKSSFFSNAEIDLLKNISILFYKSLIEFRKRNVYSDLLNPNSTFEISSNIDSKEFSFLDLILSFVKFYNNNKNIILYYHKEFISNNIKKPNWEKTISKKLPILLNSTSPIYINSINKGKEANNEEKLLICFFSILNYLNDEYVLNINININVRIQRGHKFHLLVSNGIKTLRKIKHIYFSDILRRMYHLCELYFKHSVSGGIKKRSYEFILIKNYNVVFEDIIDKLLTETSNPDNILVYDKLKDLKYNKDGKIIDHIYEYTSLIDSNNIFYIGDSKYYKPESSVSRNSSYKQFTYAKNIIQYNIDIYNKTGLNYNANIKYRDPLTEGYSITPNFFIFGAIFDLFDFNSSYLRIFQNSIRSYHFEDRVFDRDSLFILQFQINFLFALKSYTTNNLNLLKEFKRHAHQLFRKEFIDFLNDSSKCGFEFYSHEFEEFDLHEFLNSNFRMLNGKCIVIDQNCLLVAKHHSDISLDNIINFFDPKRFV